MLDRTIAPPFGAIKNPGIRKPERIDLSNGSPVYILNAGEQPVIKLEIILQSGIWHETLPGLSWITAKMLPEGSNEKSANQIAGQFEFYGAFIEIHAGFDNTSVIVHTPKKHFEPVVELLAEIVFRPSFEAKELEILKTNKIQQLKVNNEKTNFVSSRKIREALFGLQHPYGRSLSENEVGQIKQSAITRYFEDNFFQSPEFLISGMVEASEVDILTRAFDIPLSSSASANQVIKEIEGVQDIYVEKEESVQSSIRLGWHIPDKSHPDHYRLMILNEILGGYFSSRLMKNLREDKGYTYGVHSYPAFLQHNSFLLISADVIAASTNDALSEIHKEMEILQNDKMDASELEIVRNYMAGSFLSSISSPFQVMEKFKSVHQHRLDYSYYDQFFDALQSITPADIQDTAIAYFQTDKLHSVVVGKK
ncbi:MAG: pitrilysin family protein [Cyclobacteriaceae bacterium]